MAYLEYIIYNTHTFDSSVNVGSMATLQRLYGTVKLLLHAAISTSFIVPLPGYHIEARCPKNYFKLK